MRYVLSLLSGLVILLPVLLLAACGVDDADEDTSTASVPTWETVQAILEKGCAGQTSCHGSAETGTNYVNSQSSLDASASDAYDRVLSDNQAVMMPKPGYDISLSAADKTTLLEYLAAKK